MLLYWSGGFKKIISVGCAAHAGFIRKTVTMDNSLGVERAADSGGGAATAPGIDILSCA